ncbi:hypothetical protein KC730_01155, partial [Candidatus Kaiserbacteria bacterium]|nr:hypothetical protein [Candidatus Kaiserbacteria bacterium]
MANDSSLGGAVNPIVFDLDSQKGVAVLLASVRASAISVEQKNELRDLIFQYTNSGKDPSARISLEQKVNSSGIVPTKSVQKNIVEKLEASPAPIYQFGTSRPSPSFAVSSVPQAAPKPVTPPVPPPAPVNPPPPAPAKPVVEVPPSPPKSEPEKKIPAPEPVSPPPAQAPVAENVPVPTEQPTPVPVSYSKNQEVEPAADPSQGLQRIREIKSQVNEKIGNPVNLVDINNEVGREYMSAMLDAMKKLNTGSSAVSAM